MKKLYLILLLPYVTCLKAQEKIETDRPDQTETPSITPQGYLQVESGFLYERVNKDSQNLSHPTVLWKYGVNDHFELRMQTEINSEKTAEQTITGLAPLVFGFKAKLTDEKKWLPAISFAGHLNASDLASTEFQQTYWAPSFRFMFQHSLSEKFDLGYNAGAEWNGETPDSTTIYTISTTYHITEKLSGFAEIYGFLNKFESADHRFDAGVTYLLNNGLMIDASSGFGLSKISPDYFISCGISYRFPLR